MRRADGRKVKLKFAFRSRRKSKKSGRQEIEPVARFGNQKNFQTTAETQNLLSPPRQKQKQGAKNYVNINHDFGKHRTRR